MTTFRARRAAAKGSPGPIEHRVSARCPMCLTMVSPTRSRRLAASTATQPIWRDAAGIGPEIPGTRPRPVWRGRRRGSRD